MSIRVWGVRAKYTHGTEQFHHSGNEMPASKLVNKKQSSHVICNSLMHIHAGINSCKHINLGYCSTLSLLMHSRAHLGHKSTVKITELMHVVACVYKKLFKTQLMLHELINVCQPGTILEKMPEYL